MTTHPTSWYQPNDPLICCDDYENGADHDPFECIADREDALAELRAEW